MLNSFCQKLLVRGAALALGLGLLLAPDAAARPKPGTKGGFRMFAAAEYRIQVNRINCRLASNLAICSTGSSTVGGGSWPKGTPDTYVFAGGIQIGGIIDPASPGNIWAGDTTGASFFAESGDNGSEIIGINSSVNPDDAANWPASAFVPLGDSTAKYYSPTLQGLLAASQEDAYMLSWDGDPGQTGSRTHPLGVVVETRVLGWNYPAGNQDILYFLFTMYNVTSRRPVDYAGVRPSLRPILLQKAIDFTAGNGARFGVTFPDSGYIIKEAYAAWISDMDVANFDQNFASINVPFKLGYAYDSHFDEQEARNSSGWTFDPTIFGVDPFFAGPGFVGTKFLASPIDPNTQQEVGLTVFNTFSRSGNISDPADDHQAWRYLSGNFDPTADGLCSVPQNQVLVEKMCYVNISAAEDMRYLQSSGPFDLVPGQAQTIAVAMIFAAPVKNPPTCPNPVTCRVPPAASVAGLTVLGKAAQMAAGVNRIDSITGYLGFNDGDANGIVSQSEFLVVGKSLLGKALVAQSVFDNKFLLPFSPVAPPFFLVPGDNQVTVLWQASLTESVGDPYFAIASALTVPDPANPGGPNVVNPLYDPNFRNSDVEGYRIYRGRVSNPSELALVAQFDYGNTVFNDYRGTVNPDGDCAPELGVYTSCAGQYDNPIPGPGVAWVNFVPKDLVGTAVTQIVPGNRLLTASGKAQVVPGGLDTAYVELARDTRKTGTGTFELTNTGVPFVFVDHGVRNSLRYFYSVTSFDINSAISGPSSLESARAVKPVIPVASPSNFSIATSQVTHVLGRAGLAQDGIFSSVPSLNSTTGIFSGPFPPANGGVMSVAGDFSQLITAQSSISMRLDSMHMGAIDATGCCGGATPAVPVEYFVTLKNAVDSIKTLISFVHPGPGLGLVGNGEGFSLFPAVTVDPAVVTTYQGNGAYLLNNGRATITLPPTPELTGQALGCRFADIGDGTNCWYNGSRWFNGPSPANNEAMTDPNGGDCASAGNDPVCAGGDNNNAGALTGVTTIQSAQAYGTLGRGWRFLEWEMSTVKRAADFNVYWGAGGVVDSVVDVTHDVLVDFSPTLGATWGILNTSAGQAGELDADPARLSITDLICVEPFYSGALDMPRTNLPCGTATAYALSNTATLGVTAVYRANASNAAARVAAATPGTGFMFYLAGDVFMMEMAALPASGTVWSLRSYTGHIVGGNGGGAGNLGPYAFTPAIRPFNVPGATVQLVYSATPNARAATTSDLSNVHTVPDPYYGISRYEASTDNKILKFVGLPQKAIIRIYSSSGVLVRILEHNSANYDPTSNSQGGEEDWDLRNRNNQVVASGVYFWHVEAGDARRTGRFTVITFAQ